ncbi:MAG: tetratricopeptide repeat protein, partial [Deltaproteobacteria bacterium]|nr:tetratricopeptide repeat protein [Deltaproteobacteria bacterium]
QIDQRNEVAREGEIVTSIAMGKKPSEITYVLDSMKIDFPKNLQVRRLLAQSHLEKNDPNTAIKEYTEILKINPKDGATWLALGKVLADSKRYPQAVKAFDRALVYKAPQHEVYFEKGKVHYYQNEHKPALSLLRKCTTEEPDHTQCWLYQALVLQKQKEYAQAESVLLNAAGTSGGKSDLVYAALGDVYFLQKEFSKAQTSYQKAVSIDKSSAHGHYGMGRVYEELENDKSALAAYQKAAKHSSQYALMSKERQGYIFLRQKKHRDSFRIFKEVTTLQPNSPQLWNAFGEAAYGINDYTTAIDAFDRSIAFQSPLHAPYANKALTYKTLKQWSAAKKAYEISVSREPHRVDHWENLYEVAKEEKDYATQVRALSALENLEKTNVLHSYRLGQLYEERNSLIQAKEAYSKAIARDPNHEPSLEAIGNITYKAKEYDESKKHYKTIFKNNSNHLLALDRLANIAYIEKEYQTSINYDEQYLKLDSKASKQAYRYALSHDHLKTSPKILLEYYQRAYSLDADNAKAGIRVAQLKEETGDKKGAIATYQTVLSKTPETHEALEQKAILLLSLKKYQEAAEHFEVLHKQRAPTAQSAKGMARSYRLMNEHKKAEKAYELALSLLENEDEEVMYELALVQESLGKNQEAKDTLRKITLKNAKAILAQEKLGDLYMVDQEPKKAIAAYAVVTDQRPNNAQGHEKLGLAYKAAGQSENAISSLKRSIALDDTRDKSFFALAQTDAEKSLGYYQRATQIQPKSLQYQLAYAQELYDQKKYSQSLIVFKKCEEIDDKNVEVLMGLSRSFEANAKFKEAAETYDRVVRLDSKNILAWVGKGRAHDELQEYEDSAKAYEKAYQLDSKDIEVAYLRARAYQKNKDWEKSIAAFDAVITLDSKHFGALSHQGEVYYGLKKMDLAQAQLERAVAIDARHAPSQEMLGEIYFEKEAFQESFAAYQIVKEVEPKKPISYLRLGMILSRWDKLDGAEEELKHSIKLDDKNALAHYELGQVYQKMEKISQALTSYERATQIDDKYAEAWYAKAIIFNLATQKRRKVRAFEKAIAAKPDYTQARFDFAKMYESTQEYLLAIEQYRAIIGYAPESRDIVLKLGKLDLYVDKPEFAIRDLSVYAKNHPKDERIQFLLGQAHYENDSIKEAKRLFSQVILLDKNDAQAHTYMGLIYIKEDKITKAKRSFEKSLEIKKSQALAYYGLGQVMVKEKQYEKAIDYEKRALQLDPKLSDAYFHMGVAYKALGDEEAADDAFSKSVPVDSIDGVGNPKDLDKAYKNFKK